MFIKYSCLVRMFDWIPTHFKQVPLPKNALKCLFIENFGIYLGHH